MHSSYDYPYPPLYIPDPYRTTYIPHHRLPEIHHHHHYPLEHFRHAVGQTLSNVADGFVHPFGSPDTVRLNPAADVTETEKSYVIDVELPGVEREEEVRLEWAWKRTLLVEARVERSGVGGGEGEKEAGKSEDGDGGVLVRAPSREDVPPLGTIPAKGGDSDGKAKKINAPINGTDDTTKNQEMGPGVALTVRERRIGLFARAFSFPTAVDQEKVQMSLRAGVLRLKVPKMEEEEGEGKRGW